MNLKLKIVATVCVVITAFGAVDYAVQERVVLPSFEALERDLAITDMQRVSHALDRELSQLLWFCADWGNWTATYQYAQDRDPRFLEINMTPAAIRAAKFDLVAITDRSGNFIWRVGFDPLRGRESRYSFLETAGFPAGHPFHESIVSGSKTTGLVNTEFGPMMLAVSPVLDGNLQGPHRGAMIVGRVLTRSEVEKIGRQAEVSLVLKPVGAVEPPVKGTSAIRIVPGNSVNQVYRDVADVFGNTVLTWKIDVPRSISARGRAAARFAFGSLLAAGAVLVLLLIEVLRRMILEPLARITRHAATISETDDLSRRLSLARGDELGTLATELDGMVDRLADARRRLADASFEAGVSESASGVLHNIGNALTPLTVRVSEMQVALSEIPAEHVEVALAELERPGTEAGRGADLEEFLHLAGIEACRVLGGFRSELAAVAGNVAAIQDMLASEANTARNSPVLELIRLDVLVREATALVTPAGLQKLRLIVDESVVRIRALELPRIILQQVFQNLIINASEAAQPAGGILRISAEVSGAPGRQWLQVTFRDNGSGISAEHLPHLFDKGFSTKSTRTNSGTGLHWTANAIISLGGWITADSPGEGQGAQFVIVLPLQSAAASGVAAA